MNNDLFSATTAQDLVSLEHLIRVGHSLEIRNQKGLTPLATAAISDLYDAAQLLLEGGADVNTQGELTGRYRGWTPLMLAAFFGHSDIVKLLLSYHANPSLENENGRTALWMATDQYQMEADQEYFDIMSLLSDAGAPPLSPLEVDPIQFLIWSSADSPYEFGPLAQDYTALFNTESESWKSITVLKKYGDFDFRIQWKSSEITFGLEPGGLQVYFQKGEFDKQEARKFVEEICKNLEQVSPYRINLAERGFL